jgi:hypothetical protein
MLIFRLFTRQNAQLIHLTSIKTRLRMKIIRFFEKSDIFQLAATIFVKLLEVLLQNCIELIHDFVVHEVRIFFTTMFAINVLKFWLF